MGRVDIVDLCGVVVGYIETGNSVAWDPSAPVYSLGGDRVGEVRGQQVLINTMHAPE